MGSRRLVFRIVTMAAWLTLVFACFLPIVFIIFMAGGFAPQYGEASLLAMSPVAAMLLTFAIGVFGGVALVSEPQPQARWLGPLGGLLIGLALLATAYTFSPIAALCFHPAGMSAVALGGVFLLIAARLGRREGLNAA